MDLDSGPLRLKNGSTKAWDQNDPKEAFVSGMVEQHRDPLTRFVQSKVKCWELAAEIAQESFLKFMSLDAPQDLDHPRAYLFQIARNLAFDKLRRDQLSVVDNSVEFEEENYQSLEDSPEDNAQFDDIRGAFLVAFDELPPRCKQVFYLRRYMGRPVSEIARTMKISTRMVHKHMTRALAHIELALQVES